MNDTGSPYVGRSLLRREDHRLLTGQGQFVADLVLPRCCMRCWCAARRACPHPRGRSVARRRRCRASSARSTAPTVAAAAAGARGADLDAEQMDDGRPAQIPQPAAAALGARQGAPCRRGDRGHRRREPRPGRGRRRSLSRSSSRIAGGGRPRGRAARRTARSSTTGSRPT